MRCRGFSARVFRHRAVAALLIVGAVCGAVLVANARSQAQGQVRTGPPFLLNDDIRTTIKYYEGIRLNAAGDRACLYNDGDKSGCASLTKLGKGDCTIGWGHKLHDGPCGVDNDKYDDKQYEDGITLERADQWLDEDIKKNALDPLNDCVTVPLSAGELSALVSFLFNNGPGPVQGKKKHWFTDKKTGKRKLIPCVPGPVAKLLNQGHYDQLPGKLREYVKSKDKNGKLVVNPGLVKRREWEVYDATDGLDGEPRPAKWYVTAGVRSKDHGVGSVIVNGKVCATNERGVKRERCGPFSVNEGLTVEATTHDPNSRFVRWEGGVSARDLCAGHGSPCTIHVRDQLVRVVAVFERVPPPPNPPPQIGSVQVSLATDDYIRPDGHNLGSGNGYAVVIGPDGRHTVGCETDPSCSGTETFYYPVGTVITIEAYPRPDSTLDGWSKHTTPQAYTSCHSSPGVTCSWSANGCAAGAMSCTVTIGEAAEVWVWFGVKVFTLTVDNKHPDYGDAEGGAPGGVAIGCGNAPFPYNPQVCSDIERAYTYFTVGLRSANGYAIGPVDCGVGVPPVHFDDPNKTGGDCIYGTTEGDKTLTVDWVPQQSGVA